MSVVAQEIRQVAPGVFRWECFSPEHKVELTSHAVVVDGKLYIFDPIELASEARQRLLEDREVAAIVLTNENHERSSASWYEHTRAPIWTHAASRIDVLRVNRWLDGKTQWGPWIVAILEGGARGEVALRWRERSLVVLGDAVFNLPKHGFDLLPEKYCQSHGRLKEALGGLTDEPFETALMAHGAPLLEGASERIRRLVAE